MTCGLRGRRDQKDVNDEVHGGRVTLFRRHGLRGVAQGWGRHRTGGGARRRRPAGRGRAEGRRRRPRAGQSQDRSRGGHSRRHRHHRRRAHARAGEQRGAGAVAPGRHRLSPVAAAAPSRHRRGGMDDPRRRPDRRRLRLPPGRRLGCRRRGRAGLVLCRQGRIRARPLGARAGADGLAAVDAGRAPRGASTARCPRSSRTNGTRRARR